MKWFERKRKLQLFLNIHRIHHINWSFGYVFRPFGIAYFDDYGFKRVTDGKYHNCTKTGRY